MENKELKKKLRKKTCKIYPDCTGCPIALGFTGCVNKIKRFWNMGLKQPL